MLQVEADRAYFKSPVNRLCPEDGFSSLYYIPWSVAIPTAERSRHGAKYAKTWDIK